MDFYGWAIVLVLWTGGVQRLSAAGIRKACHRGAALVLIYPLNVAGAIIGPSLLVALVFNLPGGADAAPAIVPLACVSALALLLGAMLASAHFVRKIVKALESDLAEESAVDVLSALGQYSQRHEAADPEGGQNDRKQE